MGGPKPAMRDGIAALIAHDETDSTNHERVYSRDGRLEVSKGIVEARMDRDVSTGYISSIEIDIERDGATITETFTITRNSDDRIIKITRS